MSKREEGELTRVVERSELICEVRGRRQAHNPTLAKIMRLAYDRSHSHNRPQTAACNAVYSISRRALVITRLGEHLPRPRQVSMSGSGVSLFVLPRPAVSSCGLYPQFDPYLRVINTRGPHLLTNFLGKAYTYLRFQHNPEKDE